MGFCERLLLASKSEGDIIDAILRVTAPWLGFPTTDAKRRAAIGLVVLVCVATFLNSVLW